MNLPEGWPTPEMQLAGWQAYHKIMDGHEPTGLDAIAVAFNAMLAAAPTPPSQEDEPVAWRYKSARGFWRYVGNRPNLELAPTLEAQPLFCRPDDKLRRSAEEIYGKWKAGIIGSNEAMIELRVALEGK